MRMLVYGSPPRRLVPGQHGQDIIDRPMLKGIAEARASF